MHYCFLQKNLNLLLFTIYWMNWKHLLLCLSSNSSSQTLKDTLRLSKITQKRVCLFCLNTFGEIQHCITCSAMDLLQWMGAVRMRAQIADNVMFLSAVWTLILTAPIHCRASIGEQVMQCYISPNLMKKQTRTHLGWHEGERIFNKLSFLDELLL